MTKKELVLSYSKKNKLLYTDIVECIFRKRADIIYADSDGVLLKDIPSGIYMFACDDKKRGKEILKELYNELDKDEGNCNDKSPWIVAHGESSRDAVKDISNVEKEEVACFQVVYDKEEKLPVLGNLKFRKAGKMEIEIIKREYDRESPSNLEKLYKEGQIYCAFLPGDNKEEFIGFIGRHPEGSMGLLLIFPEFRRRGYASELESFMTNVILEEGRIPYAHIIEDNFASENLQKKLGFSTADKKVYWLALR